MRTTIVAAAAALCLTSLPASAVPNGATLAFASTNTGWPAETMAVNLQAGKDYALYAYSGLGAQGDGWLQNPQGQRVIDLPIGQDAGQENAAGFGQIRANITGEFFVGAAAAPATPDGPKGYVSTLLLRDCRDDVKTQCTIGFAHTQGGFMSSALDRDWYGIALAKGKAYRFTLSAQGAPGYLTFRDGRGRLLVRHVAPVDGQAFIDFKAPANGRYLVAVSVGGTGNDLSYTLAAQRR